MQNLTASYEKIDLGKLFPITYKAIIKIGKVELIEKQSRLKDTKRALFVRVAKLVGNSNFYLKFKNVLN